MEFNVHREEGYLLARVAGKIDVATSSDFGCSVATLFEQDANVLIDLAETEYINSDGFVLLLRLQQEITKRSHRLAIFGLNTLVKEVFAASHMDEVLQVVESRETAHQLLLAN